MISSRKIAQALVALNKKKDRTHDVTEKFVGFVQKYKLGGQVPAILNHIKTEAEKEKRENTVFIQSSHQLQASSVHNIKSIAKVPEHADVQIERNADLLGGFVAYWKDTKTDGSILNNLKRLEQELLVS